MRVSNNNIDSKLPLVRAPGEQHSAAEHVNEALVGRAVRAHLGHEVLHATKDG